MAAAGEWRRQTRLGDDAIASITFPVIPSLGMRHQFKSFYQCFRFHFPLPLIIQTFYRAILALMNTFNKTQEIRFHEQIENKSKDK